MPLDPYHFHSVWNTMDGKNEDIAHYSKVTIIVGLRIMKTIKIKSEMGHTGYKRPLPGIKHDKTPVVNSPTKS
ncbi:hypothetical protein E2C01_014553 [Portunus trituberculatus]|uniref:Uncharacterized protein n=1 Tax=Portunus trituberculatus TaxID=210409 RepID=A0A5B7DKT6_PORTR|nr:hypothetical protein [Portunus trituberculatus]